MKLFICAVVAALVAVLAPSSANAEIPPENASIDYPLYRPTAATNSGDTVIQLEAPGRFWGLRSLAKSIDASVDGLTIRTSGTCDSNPTAICVRAVFDYFTPEQQAAMTYGSSSTWGGLCICDNPSARTIYVNSRTTTAPTRRQVVAHEFGHALGLGHHRSEGLTSERRPSPVPSAEELVLLRNWYMHPEFAPSA